MKIPQRVERLTDAHLLISVLPSFVPSSACVRLWVVWRWRAHGNHFLNAPRNPPHQFGPKCVPGNLASMIPAVPAAQLPIISDAPLKPLCRSLTSMTIRFSFLLLTSESQDRTIGPGHFGNIWKCIKVF